MVQSPTCSKDSTNKAYVFLQKMHALNNGFWALIRLQSFESVWLQDDRRIAVEECAAPQVGLLSTSFQSRPGSKTGQGKLQTPEIPKLSQDLNSVHSE